MKDRLYRYVLITGEVIPISICDPSDNQPGVTRDEYCHFLPKPGVNVE